MAPIEKAYEALRLLRERKPCEDGGEWREPHIKRLTAAHSELADYLERSLLSAEKRTADRLKERVWTVLCLLERWGTWFGRVREVNQELEVQLASSLSPRQYDCHLTSAKELTWEYSNLRAEEKREGQKCITSVEKKEMERLQGLIAKLSSKMAETPLSHGLCSSPSMEFGGTSWQEQVQLFEQRTGGRASSSSAAPAVDIDYLQGLLKRLDEARSSDKRPTKLLKEARSASVDAQSAMSQEGGVELDAALSITAEINACIRHLDQLFASADHAIACSSSSSAKAPVKESLDELISAVTKRSDAVKNSTEAEEILTQIRTLQEEIEKGLCQLKKTKRHLQTFVRAELVAEILETQKKCREALAKPPDAELTLTLQTVEVTLKKRAEHELGNNLGVTLLAAFKGLHIMTCKLRARTTRTSSGTIDTR